MILLWNLWKEMASWTADDDEDDGETWDLFPPSFSLPYIFSRPHPADTDY